MMKNIAVGLFLVLLLGFGLVFPFVMIIVKRGR